MTSAAPDVPWQELEHAFGRASDVPPLLAPLARSIGNPIRPSVSRCGMRRFGN